jgi:hypothetical protein
MKAASLFIGCVNNGPSTEIILHKINDSGIQLCHLYFDVINTEVSFAVWTVCSNIFISTTQRKQHEPRFIFLKRTQSYSS